MKIVTSWDDGDALDLKVAELLKKYKLPGIFYIVVDWIDSKGYLTWKDVQELDKQGFEIGSHTMSHPMDMKKLYDDQLQYELQSSKEIIESVLGHAIKSLCYPRGRYDERVLRAATEAGYIEGRTTIVGDIYTPKDKLQLNTSAHVFDGRREYDGAKWEDYAKLVLAEAQKGSGKLYGETTFHLWGHSWEIEKYKQWDRLEEFFKFLGEKE